MNDGFRVFAAVVKEPMALAGRTVLYMDIKIGDQQRTVSFVCEPRDVLPIPHGAISGCTVAVDGPMLLEALRKLSESFYTDRRVPRHEEDVSSRK